MPIEQLINHVCFKVLKVIIQMQTALKGVSDLPLKVFYLQSLTLDQC